MNEAQRRTFERKRTFYQSKGLNKGHSPLTIQNDEEEKRSKSPMPFHGVNVSKPTVPQYPAYKRRSFANLNNTVYLQQY